ncbi:MAG: hypothetical protein ACR5KW_00560 [Wolbachia sp.]
MISTSTSGIVVVELYKKDDQGKFKYSTNDLIEPYQRYGLYTFSTRFLGDQYYLNLITHNTHKNIELVLKKCFND